MPHRSFTPNNICKIVISYPYIRFDDDKPGAKQQHSPGKMNHKSNWQHSQSSFLPPPFRSPQPAQDNSERPVPGCRSAIKPVMPTCIAHPLVLHADNGSPMKSTMENLGITTPYSRLRACNAPPFLWALFRACKYRPDWPTKGVATKADAQT